VVSEVGADMGKFPSDKHFASWLGLCPGTKITGGKVMSGKCVFRTNVTGDSGIVTGHSSERDRRFRRT